MAVHTEAIQKLYVAYFNRPADYEGLAHWEKVLTANNGNVDAVSGFFAASPEYQEQVAGKSNFQIVNQIYNNLFNRDADLEGLQFWADRLTEGDFTVDQIVKIIADSASDTDAKDATTYKNKVAAATAFTAELDNATEIIGYTGDKANAAAKEWLSTVGTDASLEAAIAPAALASTVATVVQASIPETQFSLTEEVETYTGTFGNDVVTAAAGEKSTLNAGDVIDGNAGNDTLNIEVGVGVNSDLSGVTIKNFETVNITGSDNLGLTAAAAAKYQALATAETALATATTNVANAEAAAARFQTRLDTAQAEYTQAQQATLTAKATAATRTQEAAAAAAVAALATLADVEAAAASGTAASNAGFTTEQFRAAATAAINGSTDEAIVLARADQLALNTAQTRDTATIAVNTAVTQEGVKQAAAAAAQSTVTLANNQLIAAETAQIAAQGAVDAAQAEVDALTIVATVDMAKFAGATSVSVDGENTTIKGVNAQTITFSGEDIDNTVTYVTGATAANIVLDGSSGNIELVDNSASKLTTGLATINLSGSSFIAEGEEQGYIDIHDNTNNGNGSVKTLKVALTNDTYVDTHGLDKLTTIDASASTGGIEIEGSDTVSSITTGSGNDNVSMYFRTVAAAGTTAAKNATVTTGAGDDEIYVANAAGSTGLTTVDAGAGNDKITIQKVTGAALNVTGGAGNDVITLLGDALATTDVIDGGEGTDTVAMAGKTTARSADDFIVFNKLVKNFETIKFNGAEGSSTTVALDASKLGANYTTIELDNNSFVAKVGTQAIVANGNVNATANGYSVASSGAVTYGGTLNITETVDASIVTARADTVNLTFKAEAELNADDMAFNNTQLRGDVKTAVVTLANAVIEETDDAAAQDVFARVSVSTQAAVAADGATPAVPANMASLASLTLKGTGGATVINGNGTALVTVDASGLSNALTVGDNAGKAAAGLFYISSNTKAETIKLGAGLDTVMLNSSTYGAVDTVTGLNIVLSKDGKSIDMSASDMLVVGGVNASVVTKMTTTQTDLDLALKEASVLKYTSNGTQSDADLVIFAMGGDTYVYSDANHSNSVDATDIVVKLTGTIDLDALSLMLKAAP